MAGDTRDRSGGGLIRCPPSSTTWPFAPIGTLAWPAGEYCAPSLAEEGFIHASGDEAQMLRVAARLFAGRTDLLVLDVDTRQAAR